MFREQSLAAHRAIVLLLAGPCLFFPLCAAAQEELACAEGMELWLSAQKAKQGSLVLVEVQTTLPVAELKANWQGQPLRFWRADNPEHTQRALLGIDLGQPDGLVPLTVMVELENGERLGCSRLIAVEEGKYAVERLRVPRKFVELNARDRARTQREGERLREIWARATPERLWQGRFHLPVEGVKASGNFGRRRVLNDQPRSPHGGEDFSAEAGTPVRAAQRGRVVLADNLFFSGNTVVLDHGLGLYTFYGHMESLAVKEGDVVEAGTVVGRVGTSGRVTGAHLHWAVRLNRARVNPLDLVALLPD